MKGFYEKARPLLENIKKWEKNWELFQDLEVLDFRIRHMTIFSMMFKHYRCSIRGKTLCFIQRKAADPNRLYNRGGVLLRESKDRAKLLKLLSKVRIHYNSLTEDLF